MSKTYRVMMRGSLAFAGMLLLAAGTAIAQDYGTVETAPQFMYIRTQPLFGGTQTGNCAGAGATIMYNVSSLVGLGTDMGFCKVFSLNNTYGVGSKVSGSEQTFLFGPRFTVRSLGAFQPFFELNFGAVRASVSCNSGNAGNSCGSTTATQLPVLPSGQTINPSSTSASKTAFGMTVGGGFDIKISKKVAFRAIQAEYLYTRFGNSCAVAYCSDNNNQNSFRLKSGLVMSWGGK